MNPCPGLAPGDGAVPQSSVPSSPMSQDYVSSERRRAVLAKLPRLHRPDGSPIRVLLVDDESSLTGLVRLALGYEGWIVDVAATGREALARYRAEKPDIVVLDIMLPERTASGCSNRSATSATPRRRCS